ncbi:LOW QUALITY PROTEIN: TBC1 domain family member 15-like [Lytechinus variegatus]|uniref:LOW QUALITY PROTEIN: TBC1 domain family member 15-like n=1 Tax=Lytechinus variegatus TaxID=7654 RepID=UPI001BB0E95F|nr:LOW QUALITY PROTEIN: TBC1 domain family member 15-like [Lytechinus variegatus]
MANTDFVSEVVFQQSGVFIHTTHGEAEDDVLLEGRVQLVKKDGTHMLLQKRGEYVEWVPIHEGGFSLPQQDQDWTMINTVTYQRDNQASEDNVVVNPPTTGASAPRRNKYAMSFSLSDVKTIRRSKQNLGWSYLVFILKDNVAMPPLHFHDGGSSAFVHVIEKYVMLTKSPNDSRLYIVTPNDTDALSRSFNELQILGETSSHVVSQFMKDPVSATMGGFSKVTNFLKDAILLPTNTHRPSDEYADLMPDLEGLSVNLQAEQGYGLVSQSQIRLGERPNVDRLDPMTEAEWLQYQDREGRITRVNDVLRRIFRGGLAPSLRKEVWKFLLRYYPWNSTRSERQSLRRKKEDEYFCMKAQWKTVTEAQERRFAMLRDRKSIIEKDVLRTDRVNPYFEGESNPHLDTLYSILMTYCMYNFDLGYVQGMSDLLSPMLIVMDDEVEAFWCLCGLMDDLQLCMNFDMEQEGMKRQLIQLNSLLQVIEPKFYSYLQSKESSNLYFCFRWLLIHFKREFTIENIMKLWEVIWTQLPCKNFHLLLCVAILNGEKDIMEREDYDFNDILKHINELALWISVDDILKKAEGIFLQLSNHNELPSTIREIIGLADRNRGGGDEARSDCSDSSIEVLGDGDPSPQ